MVKIRKDGPDGRIERVARTADELRNLLAAARNNPDVWHTSYESRRELIGDKPATCPNGHPLATTGTLAAPHDWLPCDCGGHWWILCNACSTAVVEPVPAYDCRPRRPRPNPR